MDHKSLADMFKNSLTIDRNEENVCPNIGAAAAFPAYEESCEAMAEGGAPPAVLVPTSNLGLPFPKKFFIDPHKLTEKYGVGIVALTNTQGLTTENVINMFKKFGQVVYCTIRHIGMNGIAGIIFENMIDAVAAVKELTPFLHEGEIFLVTSQTSQHQDYCEDNYDFVPLNSLPPKELDEAMKYFEKLMDQIMN